MSSEYICENIRVGSCKNTKAIKIKSSIDNMKWFIIFKWIRIYFIIILFKNLSTWRNLIAGKFFEFIWKIWWKMTISGLKLNISCAVQNDSLRNYIFVAKI